MSAREAFEKIQAFLVNVQKLICHDRIDYATMKCWFERNKFVNIFEGKDLLDSQDFYKRIMREQASNDTKAIKFGMKAIIETLANDNVRKFYMENSHNALGDAEALCRLSFSRPLHDRFRSWVICFQSLIGHGPMKEKVDVNLFRDICLVK